MYETFCITCQKLEEEEKKNIEVKLEEECLLPEDILATTVDIESLWSQDAQTEEDERKRTHKTQSKIEDKEELKRKKRKEIISLSINLNMLESQAGAATREAESTGRILKIWTQQVTF